MKTFSQFCEDASPLEQTQQLRDAEADRRAAFTDKVEVNIQKIEANKQKIETKKRNARFQTYADKLRKAGIEYDERDFAPQ
jgi:hypothetical protein